MDKTSSFKILHTNSKQKTPKLLMTTDTFANAWKIVHNILDQKYKDVYYTRFWIQDNDLLYIDYGSHTDFYIIQANNIEDHVNEFFS